MKTLVEGKDYSVHEYTTKDKRKANDRPICPTCSNCNHKEFCANRKKLFKMKECEDCNNCKDKEHCDKFYIYPKFKVELLTNGRKSTTKDTNRMQFNGKTKEEALNKMLEYIQDVSIHGKTEKTKEKDATIVSICESYETKRVRNKEIKPNTYNRHMQTIKAIGNYKFANIPIQNVTANQIKQYLESERAKSNSSIDKYYSKIKNAFSIAYANGIIQKNPFLIGEGIKKPESFKEDKKVDAFTRKEEYVLTEYLKTHKSKYKLILLIALYTGMRIGEILALRPSDINIVGNIGSINVRRTLTKDINNKVVIGDITKTKNGLRTIDLTPLAVPVIQKALEQYKENKYDVLFSKPSGNFYTDGQVNSAFKIICKNAGLRVITLKNKKVSKKKGIHYVNYKSSDTHTHMLRHTFATRCIESGIAIEVLQKILGHADITTTINTYGYIYSYLRQKELNQKYTKYMQDTNTILEENFERFEEEYLKLK